METTRLTNSQMSILRSLKRSRTPIVKKLQNLHSKMDALQVEEASLNESIESINKAASSLTGGYDIDSVLPDEAPESTEAVSEDSQATEERLVGNGCNNDAVPENN